MLIAFFGGKLWSDLMNQPKGSQIINMHLNHQNKDIELRLDQIAKCQEEKMKTMNNKKNLAIIKKINESMDRSIAMLKRSSY
jgi:hypothetical protein